MRLLSSFLLLLLAALASAQQPVNIPPPPGTPKDPGEIPVFTSDTRLVVLPVSVADKSGKLITNLTQDAFKVFENGSPQPIKIFKREDVPVSMGIIIDNSGSMREKRTKVETASADLVRASNPHDEVFVVNFNDEAFLDVEFTNDMKKLEAGLARIDSRGGTAMRDAISMSIDYMLEKGKKDKKVILVVTDGNDNASTTSLEKLVDKARQKEVSIYSIGLLNDEDRREGKKAKRALDELTNASGGLSYYPKELAEVDKIALQVAQEVRNQYTIAYSPTIQALDGSFRQIKVTVAGAGRNATVRTRTGYYATPDSQQKPKRAGLTHPSD
ncbi:MAG TPA: VWA domain-containing protein [Bryobacteraceae bacterium]|nr:VWA domain-containing protein [Bryobacteraceae bacterium]